MKQLVRCAVALIAAAVLPALAADGTPAAGAKMWNPATLATVTGTVQAVERVEMGDGWRCVRLRLLTADGAVLVRVGPDWYLVERKHAFAPGDRLQVRGSRVTFAGEPALVAGEIVRGAERMVLRDGAGKPAWDGK
jgi:hypothetical protein